MILQRFIMSGYDEGPTYKVSLKFIQGVPEIQFGKLAPQESFCRQSLPCKPSLCLRLCLHDNDSACIRNYSGEICCGYASRLHGNGENDSCIRKHLYPQTKAGVFISGIESSSCKGKFRFDPRQMGSNAVPNVSVLASD